MNRLSMLVSASILCGCGEATPSAPDFQPASGAYVQTLRAMMNLKGCKGIRGQRTSASELKFSEELIAKAEADLKEVEALARSKGLGDDLEAGRVSFDRQVAEELHVLCYPDEQGASRRAHEAIRSFRVLVVELSLRS